MPNKNRTVKAEVEKESEPDQIASLLGRASNLGNVLIALSLLSYALGFIIVNVYLATNYGIYSFEMFSTHYVYAGASFLLLCLLAYFSASFLYSKMEHIHNRPLSQRVLNFIASLGFTQTSYLAGVLSITAIARYKEINSFADFFSNFPIALWFTPAILAFYAQIHFFRHRNWEKFPSNVPFPSSILTNVIFLTVVYSMLFYSFLPPSLGGGLPTPITLIVDKNKVEIAQQLLPVTIQNPSFGGYLIEQSSDSFYVLVVNQQHAGSDTWFYPVQVDKSIIVGVVYPEKLKPSKHLNLENISFTSTPTVTLTPTGTATP